MPRRRGSPVTGEPRPAGALNAVETRTEGSTVKRLLIGVPVCAGAGAARPPWPGRHHQTDKTNAAQECRAERGTTAATREAFRVRYGTNANGRNAFGKCVSRRAKAEERQRERGRHERRQGVQGRAQRSSARPPSPRSTARGKKGKNAYGKCVSQKAKAKKDAADEADARRSPAQVRRQDLRRRAQGRPGRVQGQVRHEPQQEQRVRQVRLGHGAPEDQVLGATPSRAGRIRHRLLGPGARHRRRAPGISR